ncbi:MAG: hypothetical protein ACT4PY_07315 [Armatimonadota bacterium]
MRRLHIGLDSVRSLKVDEEIVVFFAPPIAATPGGASAGQAFFPQWRVKVKRADDDALVVELNGKIIGLSWDHIAGIQFV